MAVSCCCPISVGIAFNSSFGTRPEQREREDREKGPCRGLTSPFGNRRLHRAAPGRPTSGETFAAGAARPCPPAGGAPGALRTVRRLQKPQSVAGRLLLPLAHARRVRAAARVRLRGGGGRPAGRARHDATPQHRPGPRGPAPAAGNGGRGRPPTLRDGPY